MFTPTEKLESIPENKCLKPETRRKENVTDKDLHTLISAREKIVREENVLRNEIEQQSEKARMEQDLKSKEHKNDTSNSCDKLDKLLEM